MLLARRASLIFVVIICVSKSWVSAAISYTVGDICWCKPRIALLCCGEWTGIGIDFLSSCGMVTRWCGGNPGGVNSMPVCCDGTNDGCWTKGCCIDAWDDCCCSGEGICICCKWSRCCSCCIFDISLIIFCIGGICFAMPDGICGVPL